MTKNMLHAIVHAVNIKSNGSWEERGLLELEVRPHGGGLHGPTEECGRRAWTGRNALYPWGPISPSTPPSHDTKPLGQNCKPRRLMTTSAVFQAQIHLLRLSGWNLKRSKIILREHSAWRPEQQSAYAGSRADVMQFLTSPALPLSQQEQPHAKPPWGLVSLRNILLTCHPQQPPPGQASPSIGRTLSQAHIPMLLLSHRPHSELSQNVSPFFGKCHSTEWVLGLLSPLIHSNIQFPALC